jgi:hypothetical protein
LRREMLCTQYAIRMAQFPGNPVYFFLLNLFIQERIKCKFITIKRTNKYNIQQLSKVNSIKLMDNFSQSSYKEENNKSVAIKKLNEYNII